MSATATPTTATTPAPSVPARFRASRADGRSDATVVRELVAEQAPGTLFAFAELRAALEKDTERVFGPAQIGNAVRQANRGLLVRHQRMLRPVRGQGYRLAHAKEHTELALGREMKAHRQLSGSVQILKNVRWNELDSNQRAIHQAHLQITSGLVMTTRYILRKQKMQDDAIDALIGRVVALEERQG